MCEGKGGDSTEGLSGRLDPVMRERGIVSGEFDTMLRIAECLSRGELVGMLGDRSAGSEKTVTCRFFGRDADFPQGPLRLPLGLRVPVSWVAGFYAGGNHYAIPLHPFS